MFSARKPTHRRLTPELLATIFLVLVYIVWILSLPAWPSQDGPIHLYYVHVLSELLSHHVTVYDRFYTIKHILPPYALYYYALLALSKLCSLLLADRLVLCAYILLFIFGFRYLAQRVGPSADLSTLLAVLLALNWSAGIGFLNYCLSLSLAFWAMGLWLRFYDRSLAARLTFLFLVVAITLTHPVSLLILLAFCAVDWMQRLLFRGKAGGDPQRTCFKADLAIFAASSVALLYVRHFATAHPLSQPQSRPGTYVGQVGHHALATLEMHHLVLIFGHRFPILLYLFGSFALIVIGYVLAAAQRLRNRVDGRWTASDTWLVYAAVLLVVVPFLPSDVNDAFFFTERLSILVWLAPLVAASGWMPRPTPSRSGPQAAASRLIPTALLAFALIANLCLIWQGDEILRPIAQQMAAIQLSQETRAGQLGLVLEDSRTLPATLSGPSWNPFYWAGAHIIRRDDAVLDNSPWLDAAIIPLGAQPALPVAAEATGNDTSPHELSVLFRQSPAARMRALASADFVLMTQPGLPGPSTLDPLLLQPPGGKSWSCRSVAVWYQICEPISAR